MSKRLKRDNNPDLFNPIVRTEFSEDRLFRYWWEMELDHPQLPPLVMISLNPSKADEIAGDPTVVRGTRRAAMLGHGRYIQLNAYAWRDTDPSALYAKLPLRGLKGAARKAAQEANKGWTKRQPAHAAGLVGKLNDTFIAEAAELVARTPGARLIVGWGAHVEKVMPGRTQAILDIVAAGGVTPMALAVNADGSPKHLLYCGYGDLPHPFVMAAKKVVAKKS